MSWRTAVPTVLAAASFALVLFLLVSSPVPESAELVAVLRTAEGELAIASKDFDFSASEVETLPGGAAVHLSTHSVVITVPAELNITQLVVRVRGIEPRSADPGAFLRARYELNVSAVSIPDYSILLRVQGLSLLGRISLSTIWVHTEAGAEFRDARTRVPEFIALSGFLAVLAAASAFRADVRRWPIATLSLAAAMSASYAFVGLGPEVAARGPLGSALVAALPFLFHVSYDHIAGDVAYFILVGALCESWLGFRRDLRTFAKWYAPALFVVSFMSIVAWAAGAPRAVVGLGVGSSATFIGLAVAGLFFLSLNWRLVINEARDVLLAAALGVPLAPVLRFAVLVTTEQPLFYHQISLAHLAIAALFACYYFAFNYLEERAASS